MALVWTLLSVAVAVFAQERDDYSYSCSGVIPCPPSYVPVCGNDGVTYPNLCTAEHYKKCQVPDLVVIGVGTCSKPQEPRIEKIGNENVDATGLSYDSQREAGLQPNYYEDLFLPADVGNDDEGNYNALNYGKIETKPIEVEAQKLDPYDDSFFFDNNRGSLRIPLTKPLKENSDPARKLTHLPLYYHYHNDPFHVFPGHNHIYSYLHTGHNQMYNYPYQSQAFLSTLSTLLSQGLVHIHPSKKVPYSLSKAIPPYKPIPPYVYPKYPIPSTPYLLPRRPQYLNPGARKFFPFNDIPMYSLFRKSRSPSKV